MSLALEAGVIGLDPPTLVVRAPQHKLHTQANATQAVQVFPQLTAQCKPKAPSLRVSPDRNMIPDPCGRGNIAAFCLMLHNTHECKLQDTANCKMHAARCTLHRMHMNANEYL